MSISTTVERDSAHPMFGDPVAPWHSRFAWMPVNTYDQGWKWLCFVERRRIQKHWYLDGPECQWWQYRAFSRHDKQNRAPFDPGDPADAMCEQFRTQVTDLALAAYKITIFRDMNPQQQLECFIAGALTGLVGVCLASIEAKGADAMMEHIVACLPYAREMAESIRGPDGSVLKNHHDTANPPPHGDTDGGGL